MINKAIILPIVAAVALILKHAFGYEMPQEEIDVIVDAVLAIATIAGLFMHPKKVPPDNKDVL